MLQKNKEKQSSIIDDTHYRFTYIYRKSIPNNQFFYIVITILKFIPMIDLTQNVSELESNIKGFNYIITRIYVTNIIKFKVATYKWISWSILIALLILICVIIYTKKKIELFYKTSSSSIYTSKKIRKPKYTIKIITNIIAIISVISQNLIEFLYIAVFIAYSQRTIEAGQIFKNGFNEKDNNWEVQMCCATNILSIIIIEGITIMFYYFSSASSFLITNGFNTSFDGIYYSLLSFMSVTQGFALTSQFMQDSQRKQLNIIICFIITGYNLAWVFISFKQFVYSAIDYIIQFLHLFIFLSGTTEICLYYFSTQTFNMKLSYLKVIIELLHSLLILIIVIKYRNKTLLKEFASSVFSENKRFNFRALCCYIHLLNSSLRTQKDLFKIYKLFIVHSEHCVMANCPCKKISTMPLNILSANKFKSVEKFIIVAEHEIIKEIIKKSKTKRFTSVFESLILFHLDFISSIKNSKYLALYLSQSYLNHNRNVLYSFKTKYLLYEYKKDIISNAIIISPHSHQNNEYQKEEEDDQSLTGNLYMKSNQLKKYILLIEKIKYALYNTCEHLANFFFLKNTELKLIGGNTSKCKEFVSYIEAFNKKDQLLINELRQSFSNKNKLKNKEMCYLLSNYYLLVHIEIPNELQSILEYSNVLYNQILKDNNDFEEIKECNPMIISINNTDIFSIKYISQTLCNAIEYKKSQLINKDFNDLQSKLRGKLHSLYMKQFCLSDINQIKKKAFYIDSKGRIVPVKVKVNIFPSLSGILSLIINSIILKPNNTKQAEYHFLLDQHFNVAATNEAFEEFFFLNKEILELFRVSFCNLFSLNREKIYDQFQEAVNLNQSHYVMKKSIEEINQVLSIMTSCKKENMFYCRKKKVLEVLPSNFKPLHVITKYVTHFDLFNSITRIEKEIEEMGFDTQLNSRMLFLKERLRICLQKDNQSNCDNSLVITLKIKMISNVIYYTAIVNEKLYQIDKIKENFWSFDKGNSSLFQGDHHFKSVEVKETQKKEALNRQKTYFSRGSNSFIAGTNNNLQNPMSTKKASLCINLNETSSAAIFDTNSQINFITQKPSNVFKRIDEKIPKDTFISESSSMVMTKPLPINAYTAIKLNNKAKFCNKLLSSLNWVLTIFIFVFIISGFIIILILINKSKVLFIIYVYSTMSNGNLSFCSLNIISNCLISDKLHPEMKMSNEWLLNRQVYEMKDTFYLVKKYLSQMANDKQMIPVLNEINQLITLKYIYEDYRIKERVSSIWEEIFYLHYLINSQMIFKTNEECRVRTLFFNEKFIHNTNNPISTNKEQMMFYVIYNVLPIIRSKLFQIMNMTLKAILDYNHIILTFLQFIDITIICLIVVLYAVFIIQLCRHKQKLKKKLNCLLIQRPAEEYFEDTLKQFMNIINDFDHDTIIQFEDYKNKTHLLTSTLNTKTQLKNSFHISSSSAFSSSRCNSSKQSFKKSKYNSDSNKDKGSFNHYNITSSSHSDQNDNNQTVSNKKTVFEHYFVSIAFIITIIMFTINLVFQFTNIFLTYKYFKKLELEIELGFHFIQRIPTIVDLALYYITSITMNNENYIRQNENEFINNSLSNYYSNSPEETNETLMLVFNASYYSQLYYHLKIERKNIDEFMKSNDNKIFAEVYNFEQGFNDAKQFILLLSVENSSMYYNDIRPDSSLLNIIDEISTYAIAVESQGNKINSNGLDPVIDLTIQEFNTNFLSFFSIKDKERRNQTEYIVDKDIADLIQNIQVTLNGVYNIYSHLIVNTMIQTYDKTKQYELWLFIISLFSHFFFSLIMILILLAKLEKTEVLFSKTKMIILNAIRSNCNIIDNPKIH